MFTFSFTDVKCDGCIVFGALYYQSLINFTTLTTNKMEMVLTCHCIVHSFCFNVFHVKVALSVAALLSLCDGLPPYNNNGNIAFACCTAELFGRQHKRE